jgi:hypothetical protein
MNKKTGPMTAISMAVLAIGFLLSFSCAGHPASATGPQNIYATTAAPQNTQQVIQQYIPPLYYACSETTPENLAQAYYSHYYNVADAENTYNGQVFVFKNITITESAIKYATDEYMWVAILQCYFMKSGAAKDLKAGDKVDIVGIDIGVSKDYIGTLIFTGCIFLPAGSVQLPAAGTSSLGIPSY